MHRQVSIDNIAGVLLDFDGTIVPSEKVFFQTWQEVFLTKYGCNFTLAEYIKYELEQNTQLINFLKEQQRIEAANSISELMQDVYAA